MSNLTADQIMKIKITDASDPAELRAAATDADTLAAALRDRGDAQRIGADLLEQLQQLDDQRDALLEQLHQARAEHADAVADVSLAEAGSREKAAEIFDALADRAGEAVALQTAGVIAEAALRTERETRAADLDRQLAEDGVPEDLRRAAVENIAARDQAQLAQVHVTAELAARKVAEAEQKLADLAAREQQLRDALRDPLNRYDGTLSDAWLIRCARTEVFRRVLMDHAAGRHVPDDLYHVCLLVAAENWRADALLAGDLADVQQAMTSEPQLRAQVRELSRLATKHGFNIPGTPGA